MPATFLLKTAIVFVALLQCLLALNNAPAATVTLTAVADASLKSFVPNDNYGSDSNVSVYLISIDGTARSAMVLRFDLSTIPSEAIIDSASLQFYLNKSYEMNPVDLTLRFVTSPWAESTITWNTAPTVSVPPIFLDFKWQMDGVLGWKSFNINTSWVSSWIAGQNDGLMIYRPDTDPGYERTFNSRENGSNPPRLVVTYHRTTAVSGHVYAAETIGGAGTPRAGVIVSMYCSNNANLQGTQIDQTTTDAQGGYSLTTNDVCEYYNVMAPAPAGYYPLGATSSSGIIKAAHWIQYLYNQTGQTFTGDAFWVHEETPTDGTPPGNWANFVPTQWANSQTVAAHEQVEDTFSGLDVSTAQYAYSINGGSSWSNWLAASITGTDDVRTPQIISANVPFGQDSGPTSQNWVQFRVTDMVGNRGTGPTHPIKVDSVAPQNPTSLTSTTHTPGVWSNNPQVTVNWSGATDDRSGLKGYSYNWDHSSATVPGVFVDTANTSLTVTSSSDSSNWWFHVRSLDQAGNAAGGAKHLGPFQIDTSPPTVFLTAPPGGTMNTATFNVSWSGSDGPSGIASYDVQTTTEGEPWSNWQMGVTYQSAAFTGERGRTYSLRVRATDQAGNLSDWSASRVVKVGGDVIVRVENEDFMLLAGAEIYLNGARRSTYGTSTILSNVLVGDELVARYKIEERPSPKGYHDWIGGDWSYRIYITSLGFDNAGNPQVFTVSNLATTQVLVVRRNQPLIGFYMLASVEWDASAAYLNEVISGLRQASAYLYDLTDGQMLIETIEVRDDKSHWNEADIRIHADNNVTPHARVGGIWEGTGKHINVGRDWGGNWDESNGFRTLIHEFGHYGFDLYDEYLNADGANNGTGFCTTDRSNSDGADQASFMDIQQFATEMCSSLTIHPHNTNTMQHEENGEPCWATVYDRYRDTQYPPRWIITRPSDRGSIMPGPTSIPVADWVWGGIRYDANTGVCAPFEIQYGQKLFDELACNFSTWIDDYTQIYQGKTDNTTCAITILGAHHGDTIRLYMDCGFNCSVSGSTTASCPTGQRSVGSSKLTLTKDPFALAVQVKPASDGTTVEITAQASTSITAAPMVQVRQAGSLDPINAALTFDGTVYKGSASLNPELALQGVVRGEAKDSADHTVITLTHFTLEPVASAGITWLRSIDAKMEMFLKPGSLEGAPIGSISSASQVKLTQAGIVLAGAPYTVTVSNGSSVLKKPATVNLYYQSEAVDKLDARALRIFRWDAQTETWVDDGGQVNLERQVVSTQVERLGTFVLAVDRKLYLPFIVR